MEIKEVYRYCPRCRSQWALRGNLFHCDSCSLDFYLNPKPVTSVILKKQNGKYLFTVRAHEPFKGRLDFPGGFVDENEDFEESARREVKEELGIEIGPLEYLCSATIVYPFKGINHNLVGVSFTAELPENAQIKAADDVADYRFYKLEEVPMDELADEATSLFIKKLKALNDS